MSQLPADPVIDEIREIRHRISAACDHDPAKLVAYFRQIQVQYQDRLITTAHGAVVGDAPEKTEHIESA